MVKLLDNIVVNNNEYTFVDSFLFKNILVNCYLGDEDYLFAFFKDKKEIFIDDEEIIKAIKEQEGLNIPEVYYAVSSLLNLLVSNMKEIPSDDVMEMINYFTLLIKKSGMMIDEDKLLSKLSKVNFIEGQMEGCTGFYHPATNSIIVSSASDYSVMVHEMIHACGGRIYNVFSSIEGFIEGGTELTTRRLIGDLDNGVSSYGHLMFKSGLKGYQMPVAIVRQMEYLINDSVSESILLGKWDFFDNFKKKYGSSIYRFLKHRTTRMAEMKKDVDYCIKYFLETQKLLYETVFDKDIKDVKDLDTAIVYVEKLKNFEEFLGFIPGDIKADGFIEYYEKKLFEIKKILESNNVSEKKINDFIMNNRHELINNKIYKEIVEDAISLRNGNLIIRG